MATEVGSLVAQQSKTLMAPPAPRPAKRKPEQVVLDEDEWVDKIEAIIQRDYFPDLPKLENELEWLEAVRSKDPVLIRQAQNNIVMRRAGLRTPMGQTPATFATPATGGRATPNVFGSEAQLDENEEGNQQSSSAPQMSLDKFMAKHTSEDNASFNEILEGINKRRRLKYEWLRKNNQKPEVKQIEQERPLDGFGTSGQPSGALLNWPYKPDNTLYYEMDSVPYSDKELAAQVQGPPKEISATNTRLPGSAGEEVDLSAAVKRAARGEEYERVATPSFTPGPDALPPMTWGRLEATPARIEDESAQPRFRVPERKPKDILAHRLADGARLNLQKRASLLSPAAHIGRATPRPRSRLVSRSPAVGAKVGMSPAAHRLASSLHGKGATADFALRASYSKTGKRAELRATPGVPGPADTPAILRTPGLEPAAKQSSNGGMHTAATAGGAADPGRARIHALKAFEQTAARRDALKAFGKITDDLLDL